MAVTRLQVPALDNDEYTVGWITALVLEGAAAEAMLDVEHEEPQWQHENDHNTYTLGSIGKHNVVIASLPETYGPTAAATAVSQMLSSFKSIRIGLMVGIGGGIPNLEGGHDIRLGDVVVSRPENTFGGVKQYDFGKTNAGGIFQPRGFLNAPPRVLLNAVNKLKRTHLRWPSDVPKILREMEKNNPLMVEPTQGGPSYLHQGSENDCLFHSSYNHKEGAKTCKDCDGKQEINRPLRTNQDPFIHYGTIASGNQVIKDGETRDRLGNDCLCFEMEAAGLMNDFPCLVIRGICDYADSHKNKRWQNYAAATAAAYAKELLGVTPPHGLRELPKATAVMMDKLQAMDGKLTQLTGELEAQHNQEYLNWLSPLEPSKRHHDVRSSRLIGSGKWILHHTSFLKWLSDSPASPTLWCYGDPGAGKTFIASLVIDNLEEMRASKPKIGLSYVYCDYRDQILQTTANICGSILKQLLKQLLRIPEEMSAIWQKNDSGQRPLELAQVIEALRITYKSFDRTYICLDALDECKDVDELLKVLQQAPSSVHLFSTGRNHIQHNVQRYFEQTQTIYVEASEYDIRMLIQKRINEDRDKDLDIMSEGLEHDIIERISALSNGIFLLPVLQIRTVLEARTPRDRREALDDLTPNLEEAFGTTVQRIQTQPKAWAEQAKTILTWIHLAERPLSIDQLLEAYAVREGDNELDRSGFPSRSTLLDCCLGLAIIEKETSTVRLVHFSLQEYFEKEGRILDRPIKEGHEVLSRACLTYLMFRSLTTNTHAQATMDPDRETYFVEEMNSDQDRVGTSSPLHHLLDYAACQWGHHVRKSGCLPGSTIDMAITYLRLDLQRRMRSHRRLCKHIFVKAGSFSPVHIGAYFGIHQILLELLEISAEIDLQDIRGRTPLSWAAWEGHEAIVKLLLNHSAKVDLGDEYSQTPLSYAAQEGHKAVVEVLLEHGAKVDLGDEYSRTPLSYAAQEGHKAVAEVLLEHGAKVDLGDERGRMPLSLAARYGHDAVAKLLLEYGAKVDSHNGVNPTLLSEAAAGRYDAVVKLQLKQGAKIDFQDRNGRTPLPLASNYGYEAVVELLLEQGAGVDMNDDCSDLTPLSRAAENRQDAAAEMLSSKSRTPVPPSTT